MRLTTTPNDLNRSSCHQVFVGASSFSFVLGSIILVLLLPLIAVGQRANLTDDAQVSSNTPNQNFGSKTTVQVSGTNLRGFFKFKLTPNLPNGTTGGQIEKATLKMYVSAINTPGSLELHRVDGVWDEGSITNNSAPPIGVLLSTVAVDATQQDRWIVIEVTSIVKDWLDGAQPNNGVALLAAPSGINVTFNSKENQATSHEPILEISLNHVAEADHALTADNATTATIASTANALSGSASVNGNQINGDLTNATIAGNRVIGTVANSTTAATANALSGILPIANGGTGSSTQNFVDLSTNQTIAGNKTFSNPVNTNTQYNIGGFRILHNTGASNLFAGIAAGDVNTGSNNAFYGFNAGKFNTTGSLNSFFGQGAGQANTTGQNNAFFGSAAGTNNTTAVRNSFFGSLAGVFNTTGGFNSFFGTQAAFSNTTGVRNSFFGNQSGQANTSGNSNVFVGDIAGFNNTSGSGNTFVGQNAGSSNTTENQNTFVGAGANGSPGISNSTAIGANSQVTTSNTMVLGTNALTVQVPGNLNVSGTFTSGGTLSANVFDASAQYNIGGTRVLSVAGTDNVFAGAGAGGANSSGLRNSFFGKQAGANNTTASFNSFFGNNAGLSNTTGNNNSFFGFSSGANNTTGVDNAFFGFRAGEANTASGNAFFGGRAGASNLTGTANSFFGNVAGTNNTTGDNNSFFGTGTGFTNTTGANNSFFGKGAGQNNSTGNQNSFFGSQTGLANSTGNSNSFFGFFAGNTNSTGSFNSFFGQSAGFNNTTGSNNAFFGADSGLNTTSNQNSFFGAFAGNANTSGSLNSFVGNRSGFVNTSGDRNTFIGQNAGASNTTESDNTFIGFNSNGAAGITNSTAIGANSVVSSSNTMVLGTNAITVQVPGNLNVSGSFTGSVPAGSSNYIQNTTTQQASSNFSISGDGTAGGTLSGNTINAATQFNIGGFRIFHNTGGNLSVGIAAGESNTTGGSNSYFGLNAGRLNTTGGGNAFFGAVAGQSNIGGSNNAFFGFAAGGANTNGSLNAFFGQNAGVSNTTGNNNAFFGGGVGQHNTTGNGNAFFGSLAGLFNTTASGNAFFGTQAGWSNTTGDSNVFMGIQAGLNNTTGRVNTFVGTATGSSNTTGDGNSFFGQGAGGANTTGMRNTFLGVGAGSSNTFENDNTFIGFNSNGGPGINNATAIGANSQVTTSDTIVLGTNAITVQVPGNLSVTNSFSANGSNLTNLNASNVTTGTLDNARLGVVPVANGGTGSSTQNFVDLSTTQTVSGNKSFTNSVNVGNSTTGGSLLATNTVNRFLELGSNVSFDSVPGTVVGIRLKATNPAENYSYGIFHGSNVYPGALIFRKDDESISPGDLRNRLIIAGNGDILVNPGSVGIGTATPTQKLEVNNGNLRLFRNDGGRPAFIMNLSGAAWTQLIQPDSRLDFVPAEGPGAAVLTLSPSGNVGIGTTAPGNLLHLSSAAGAPGIQIDNTTSAKSFSLLNVAGSNPRLSLNDVTAGTERLVIDSSGNVGIGTVSPSQKLEVVGNLRIDGDFFATGAKSAVVTLADKREVALYAVESTGNWFEDFGSGKLNNGVAEIQLDSLFAQTVNTDVDYHVFLTPNGNCNGLYVARKTAAGFEVRELGQGTSSISFDYRIVARRRGYENVFSGKR